MTGYPRLSVEEVEFYERDVRLRMPFRFGVVTLTEAPQAFARVQVALEDGREGWGMAAEMLAPKWFDKNPGLTNERNFDQLRTSLGYARSLYLADDTPRSAFSFFADWHEEQQAVCGGDGLNALIASFGQALLDRAIIDGLCRLMQTSVFTAVRDNLLGLDARLTDDLRGFALDRFLAGLRPAPTIHARHTVGLVDPITEDDIAEGERLHDGLPQSLEACIARYGLTYFKLKVGGDLEADIDRLARIAAVLDGIQGPYFATLDGNEQYADAEAALALWRAIEADPRLARLKESILFVEQPINRARALDADVTALAARKPVEIDESDDSLDAFPRAKALGYTGVSSKSCKGFYKSLLNRARCAAWNRREGRERYFMSAEDLTTQAGLALQQDLALATLIGCTHVERNGHHYVNGMAGAPEAEQGAFLAAHPDLYRREDGVVRLRIENGTIALGSLVAAGLASAPHPDVTAMRRCHYGAP